MKKHLRKYPLSVPALAILLACAVMTPKLLGHSIDYVAMDISPAASFSGGSGNFTLNSAVAGGTPITFNLTFSIIAQGSPTSYSKTVTFGRTDVTKPGGAADPTVLFGVSQTTTTSCTFDSPSTTCVVGVTVAAPTTAGAYTVKIAAIDGTGGAGGLGPGNGIVVGFTVAQAGCTAATTNLTLFVSPACIVVGSTDPVTFQATLKEGSSPLSDKTIDFTVDASAVGSTKTDANGIASPTYDASALTVGDHTVVASFQGEQCVYEASNDSKTLGVTYAFLGFQPPVEINGAGVGLFSGKVIPVKIKIADANGNPVTNAEPHVFFAVTNLNGAEEEAAESIASTAPDRGNTMRYDPISDQYVFNWDVSKIANGSYNIRIDLGEGSCGDDRVATVSIQKKGGKK